MRDGEFEKIASIPTVYGSLGLLYEEVSVKVGYEHLEGPGKVMGLAPYGKASKYYENLKSFIRFDDKDYPFRFVVPGRWRVKGTDADYRMPYKFITNSLYPDSRIPWNPRGDLHPDAVDLAWAVQAVTEDRGNGLRAQRVVYRWTNGAGRLLATSCEVMRMKAMNHKPMNRPRGTSTLQGGVRFKNLLLHRSPSSH